MKLRRISLPITGLMALLLTLSVGASSWSAIETWKGFDWEDQPLAGYTGADVSVDIATDQLWVMSNGASKTSSFLPYGGTFAERYGLAKMIIPPANVGQEIVGLRARVYDPGTGAGFAVVLKNSAGKVVDFGIRPFFANGKLQGQLYDGAAWAGNTYIGDRTKNGAEYWDMTFTKLGDGSVKVDTKYTTGATEVDYSWTTPGSFGAIEDIYLTASTSTSLATRFKYTDFEVIFVPEPGSIIALGSGLAGFAALMLRRRA